MSDETPEPPFAWAVWGWLLQAVAIALAAHAAYAGPIDGHDHELVHFGIPLIFLGVWLCQSALPRPALLPPVLTGLTLALLIGGYVILRGAEAYALLPASAIRPARAVIATAWLCMLAVSIIVYVRSRRSRDVDPASPQREGS